MSTEANRQWWENAEKAAAEVATWPDWKRAGINVAFMLDKPRQTKKSTGDAL